MVPIVFVIICIFLIILPCWESPYEVGMGTLITISGIPAYYLGVCWKNKPREFNKFMGTFHNIMLFIENHYYFCLQSTSHMPVKKCLSALMKKTKLNILLFKDGTVPDILSI